MNRGLARGVSAPNALSRTKTIYMNSKTKEYYANLPKKYIASGVFFLNVKNEVLVVKPTYKNHWEIPGGIVEQYESPLAAAKRKVREELGIRWTGERLLVMDHYSDARGNRLLFVYWGGVLSPSHAASITLPKKELEEHRFMPLRKTTALLDPALGKRIRWCYKALRNNTAYSLHKGTKTRNNC